MPQPSRITDEQARELVAAALAVRPNAYAKFSKFMVGAAVLTTDGRRFVGVNVENSSYGLTICAERAAVCAAVAAGTKQDEVLAVAIASEGGAGPCGACRQFMREFGDGIELLLVDAQSDPTRRAIERVSLNELLPKAFRFEGPRG